MRPQNAAFPVAVFAAALALTAAAYWPGVRAEFVSDDINAIVENEWVVGPLDISGIFSSFSWWGGGRADAPGYRPLATLSFALNRAAAGLSPFAFHVTNYLMHALVSWLVFVLGRALGLAPWSAAVAALASCLLPIHSEAVIWAVGRAELGAAAAFLAAAAWSLRYRRSGRPGYLAAAAAAVVAGMMCKENTVTVLAAPLVFALVFGAEARGGGPTRVRAGDASRGSGAKRIQASDAARGSGATRIQASDAARAGDALPARRTLATRDVLATVVLTFAFSVYALMRVAAEGPALPDAEDDILDNQLSVLPLPTRLLGAISVLGRYLWLTMWPQRLSIDYSYDALGIGEGFLADRYSLLALAVVTLCAWAAWRWRRTMPAVAASVLLAAASYSIVSNVVYPIGTVMGERLFYLPSALLCIGAAAVLQAAVGTAAATPRRAGFAWLPRSRSAAASLAGFALVAATWMAVDMRRAAQWRTPVSLFQSAVAAVPRSARAHMELGSALGHLGRLEESRRHFGEALAIHPGYTVAAYNFGNALVRSGRFTEAEAAYRRALEQDPRLGRAWHNIALVYRVLQRHGDSADAFGRAVELSPKHPALRVEHGEALLAAGRNDEAIAAYDAAISLGGDTALVRFNRGVARQRVQGCQTAVEDYKASASMPGAPVQALHAAIACLRQLGRDAEAEALARAGKVANLGTRR